MRLFGILLIFLILLAGGGYVYLASQDYKGRQTINAAGLRHLLVLQGLPVEGPDSAADEIPFQVNTAGGESTKTISKKLLENYFKDNTAASAPTASTAPGVEPAAPRLALSTTEPVTNQVAEVKRVLALLKGELNKAATAEQKIALLEGWLLVQAETLTERAQYQALISAVGPNDAAKSADQRAADADELAHQLDRKFYRAAPKLYDTDAALAPEKWRALEPKPAAATDDADRRARIAHLLSHLDRDAAWQKRVGVVVGLRRYVGAIATQASRFREMRAQVDDRVLASDQATFQQRQDLLLNETRRNLDKTRAVAEDKARRAEQKTAADDAVNRRRTQIKELSAQLKKVRDEVDELLVQQTGIEKQLYDVQREVGLTLEEVYRLDALLVDIERERYGIPPRTRP